LNNDNEAKGEFKERPQTDFNERGCLTYKEGSNMRGNKRGNCFSRLILSFAVIIFAGGIAWGAELNVPKEFKSIGDAVAKASDGDIIRVAPGTYQENVVLKSGVTLIGAGAGKSIIDGGGNGTVVICKGASVLNGFTIRNSGTRGMSGETMDSGVKIYQANAMILNNRITSNNTGVILVYASKSQILNNEIFDNNRFGVYILYSKPDVTNNRVAKNKVTGIYSGYSEPKIVNNVITMSDTLIFSEISQVTIKNNILTRGDNGVQIAEDLGSQQGVSPAISYNIFWSNEANYVNTKAGRGDISVDPMFVDAEKYNFRLKKGSMAVDAGDSYKSFFDLDGSRNDIGAFGGPTAMIDIGAKKKKTWKKSKWFSKRKKSIIDMSTGGWETIKTTDEMQTAKGNYMLFCSSCHGLTGDGRGGISSQLDTVPRDHTDGMVMSAISDETLFAVISEGGATTGYSISMPSHRTVMPKKDITGLVKYIRLLCDCTYKKE
jgi:parallel beta-helix repeat protein